MTASDKDTVWVVDHASQRFCEAIHAAGYRAGALVLWHDRVTPSQWAVDASGYDIQIRMDLKMDSLDDIENALRKTGRVAGIIPTNEPSEEAACRLAARFDVPHNDPEIAKIRWHKGRVKDLAASAGLRVPKYKECRTESDIKTAAKDFDFPVFIKTPKGSAGQNVFKCTDGECLLEKHRTIVSTPNDFGHMTNHSLIEEYIGGEAYQVSTFSDGKDVHVTEIWTSKTVGMSRLHNYWWLLDRNDPAFKKISDYAKKVAKANKLQYGPGDVQLKLDDHGHPALLEVHARFSGGEGEVIVKNISNFDPMKATVEVFTKGASIFPRPIRFSSYFAIVSCPAEQACEHGETQGIEDIVRLESFHSASLEHDTVLHSVRPTTNFTNYPLIVWLANTDQAKLVRDARRVHELFQIVCK